MSVQAVEPDARKPETRWERTKKKTLAFGREKVGSLVCAGFFTGFSILASWNKGPLENAKISVIAAIAGAIFWDYVMYGLKRQEDSTSLVESIESKVDTVLGEFNLRFTSVESRLNSAEAKLKTIEDRLPNTREISALFTDTNDLEHHLGFLHDTVGGLTWIVAKFISKKLSQSFTNKLTMEIDGDDYSLFAARLYPECERSIALTSPFTPREWFEELFTMDKIDRIKKGEELAPQDVPQHVRALLNSQAPIKRRLVILSDEAWREVECDHSATNGLSCQEKYYLLKEFLRINTQNVNELFPNNQRAGRTRKNDENGTRKPLMETRFAKVSAVRSKVPGYRPTIDYAIFDGSLVLQWGATEDGGTATVTAQAPRPKEPRPLELVRESGTTERKLITLFDFQDQKNLLTGEVLLTRLAHALGNQGSK